MYYSQSSWTVFCIEKAYFWKRFLYLIECSQNNPIMFEPEWKLENTTNSLMRQIRRLNHWKISVMLDEKMLKIFSSRIEIKGKQKLNRFFLQNCAKRDSYIKSIMVSYFHLLGHKRLRWRIATTGERFLLLAKLKKSRRKREIGKILKLRQSIRSKTIRNT